MPPKNDPYATRSAHLVDLLLVLLAIGAILLLILTAPAHHSPEPGRTRDARSAMTR